MENIKWMNQVKGFLMILVVVGHAIVGSIKASNPIMNAIYDYIYLFHMPLFFLLSGFLYQKKERIYLQDRVKFIQKKGFQLLVPYFSYSLFTYVGIAVASMIPKIGPILNNGGYKISGILTSAQQILFWNNSLDQHLWFIYCLFFVFIINCLFFQSSTKKVCIAGLIITLALHIIFLKSEWILLQRIFNYGVYFYLGRVCCDTDIFERVRHKKSIYVAALILSVIKMLIINILFDNYFLTSMKALFSVVVSFVMCIAVCLFFKDRIHKLHIFERVYKYNFEIYILHQPFIVSGVVLILYTLLGINDYFVVVIGTVCGILIPIAFAKLTRKVKIVQVLLFGRNVREQKISSEEK